MFCPCRICLSAACWSLVRSLARALALPGSHFATSPVGGLAPGARAWSRFAVGWWSLVCVCAFE
eukprot:8138005-Alexandrium_andersonii.AAC.1